MTLPYEEKIAINSTRDFLCRLLNPKESPRVPREIRQQARQLLRHYPWTIRLDELYRIKGGSR